MYIGNFVKITYIKIHVLSLYTVLRAINTHIHLKTNFLYVRDVGFKNIYTQSITKKLYFGKV